MGMGIDSDVSPPKSSSKFLIKMERSATLRGTLMTALSEVVREIWSFSVAAASVDMIVGIE